MGQIAGRGMRTGIRARGVFAACLCAAAPCLGQGSDSLALCLPAGNAISGWRQEDSLRVFHGKELYVLLDGGADLYLEYGCTGAAAARYAGSDGRVVSVELFRMRSPAEAYGLYSSLATAGGTSIEVGQEAIQGDHFLFLWKGVSVISIAGMDADSATRAAVDSFARAIEPCLPALGAKPDLVSFIARPGFEHEEILYIRGRLGLTNAALYGQDRLFRVEEGVIGRRGEDQDLILGFETERRATEAMGDALSMAGAMKEARLLPSGSDRFALRDGKNRTIEIVRSGRFILVAAGPDEHRVRRNMDGLLAGISRTR